MRFSLIVATLGRSREIGELLESLLAQGRDDLEVIIVDQNADDRVAPILAPYASRLRLTHLRSSIRNANHARNLGLRAAQGEIVTFPDDDCLWPRWCARYRDCAARCAPNRAFLPGTNH